MVLWLLCQQTTDTAGHLHVTDTLWTLCELSNVVYRMSLLFSNSCFVLLSSGGDETQVALAIVLASNQDCGVYGCTINNEYGTDTTDFLLSEDGKTDRDFLSNLFSCKYTH